MDEDQPVNADAATQARFFYHSFPRRGKNTDKEIEKACKILALIRDEGLLLTPEITKWQYSHADGSLPRKQEIFQRRISFTELAPRELPRHADEFGHFALEFKIDVLRGLGAVPVFYIPTTGDEAGLANSLGATLVIQLIDAMILVERVTQVQRFIASTSTLGSRQNFTFGFADNQRLFSLDIT